MTDLIVATLMSLGTAFYASRLTRQPMPIDQFVKEIRTPDQNSELLRLYNIRLTLRLLQWLKQYSATDREIKYEITAARHFAYRAQWHAWLGLSHRVAVDYREMTLSLLNICVLVCPDAVDLIERLM